jgi:hypothetical protein
MKFNQGSTLNALKLNIDLIYKYKLVILFVFLFVLYVSNNSYVMSGDSVPAALLPWAILDEHTIYLDGFTGFIITQWSDHYFETLEQGHLISFYPIVTPLLAVPFYLPAYAMSVLAGSTIVDFSDSFIFTTGYCMKFASVTITVSGVIVLYLLLKRVFDDNWAYVLSLCYGVCTSAWTISSQSLWQHGTAQLLLVGCYYLAIRNMDRRSNINALGIGALSALAFFNRPIDAILLIPALYYVLKEKCWLSIPAFIIVGLPFLAYNQYFFGSILGGYSLFYGNANMAAVSGSITSATGAFTISGFPGKLLGEFFSLDHGLFLYTPISLLAIAGMVNALRQKTPAYKELYVTFIISLFLFAVAFGLFNSPSGWGFGPRYWADALPLIILFIGWSRANGMWYKAAFLCLAAASFIIQAYGAYVYLLRPY